MIRRILSRSPRSWPFLSPIWVVFWLGVYFLPDLFVSAFLRSHHLSSGAGFRTLLLYMHAGVVGTFVFVLGLRRANATNPMMNSAYRNWLKTTPWHPGMPLPLGPITLNIYDVALLAVTGFMFQRLDLPPGLALLAFGFPYTLSVILHLLVTGPARVSYLLFLGLLAMGWALPDMRLAGLILIAIYPIEHLAIRQSFKAFPWEPLVPRHSVPLGWSFERLGPEPVKLRVSALDALIVSLLIGLAVFLIFEKTFVELRAGLVPILVIVGCVTVFARLGIYWEGISNPLGIFTRFATGRLIVPGFDQILVAPVIAAALLLVAFKLSKFEPVQPVAAGALAAVVAMILLGMGPTLSRFRMTGSFNVSKRYNPAARKKPLSTTSVG